MRGKFSLFWEVWSLQLAMVMAVTQKDKILSAAFDPSWIKYVFVRTIWESERIGKLMKRNVLCIINFYFQNKCNLNKLPLFYIFFNNFFFCNIYFYYLQLIFFCSICLWWYLFDFFLLIYCNTYLTKLLFWKPGL